MVERSLSMREALGSMPRFSTFCVSARINFFDVQSLTGSGDGQKKLDRDINRDNECVAAIAQLGERQTEDLEVPGSIPGLGIVSWSW